MIKTEQKIFTIDEQIAQLQNQRKLFVQKKKEEDRRERTKRLCTRGGAVEKLHPELATFTDEQFDIFIRKVILSEQTKRIIAEIAKIAPEPQGGISLPESKVKPNP
jgi:hypothetical protein